MCGCLWPLLHRPVGRRSMLAAAAVGVTAASAGEVRAAEAAAADQRAAVGKGGRTRVVLLGTAGGPTYWPGSSRRSASSAVVVGDAVYMVDCGDGAGKRLAEAMDRPGPGDSFRQLRALFLTHLHSDHTVDYPNLFLYGYFAGLDLPGRGALQVYGPGRRGEMAPVFAMPGQTTGDPGVVHPDNPTPGTEDMTRYLMQAFATDMNDRIRDNGKRAPGALVQAHDIVLPEIAGFRSPNLTPSPEMAPFVVFEDDRVRVSAILVSHAPIFPAFAYRFDTDDGSVVFSGDTGPCANLVRLAQGAEVLVHEVIVTGWIDQRFPAPRSAADEGLRAHLLSAHTAVEAVGGIAEAAGVGMLVLNHLLPGNARAVDLMGAGRDFSGPLVIGEDLLSIGVRRRR